MADSYACHADDFWLVDRVYTRYCSGTVHLYIVLKAGCAAKKTNGGSLQYYSFDFE